MKHQRATLAAWLIMGTILLTAIAWAYPKYLTAFTDTYKISKTSNLGKASCAICHPAKDKTDVLNPYGKDIQKAIKSAKAKTLTPAILRKVEKLDSDKDRYTNIREIKADSLPGNPKSTPKNPRRK